MFLKINTIASSKNLDVKILYDVFVRDMASEYITVIEFVKEIEKYVTLSAYKKYIVSRKLIQNEIIEGNIIYRKLVYIFHVYY